MTNYVYTSLLEILGAANQQRLADIQRRWRLYSGQYDQILKSEKDNIFLNYARLIVDTGVSFLFGALPDFETENETAEQYISAVMQANNISTLASSIALTGGVTGHAFVKISPAVPYPRLVLLDTETVTVYLAPDDRAKIEKYEITYPSTDKDGKPVGVRQVIERSGQGWQITDEIGDMRHGNWRVVASALWPYEFSPIVDCQNLPAPVSFWGVSDIDADVERLLYGINFTASNMAKILRHHAHPRPWGAGFAARELNNATDEMLVFTSPDARLQNLEMNSDLSSSLNYLRALVEALHEISRVPEIATGRVQGIGNLSGTALRVLYQPLLQKTETKRQLYGSLLAEIARRVVVMAGYPDEPVKMVWPPIIDERESKIENALLLRQLGVSRDTLLRELGYDPAIEAEKRTSEEGALGENLLRNFDAGNE